MLFIRWLRRNDARVVVVLVATLAVSLTGNLIWWTSEWGGQHIDKYEKSNEYDCGRALIALFGNEIASKASEGKSDAKNAREYAALCQNAFSLESAKEAARSTTGQYQVGLASAVMVFAATLAAIAAACFAQGAYRQTKRQADAAEEQVRVADKAYRSLERPYLIANPRQSELYSWWEVHGGQPSVNLEIRNHGKIPAMVEQIAAHLVVSDAPPNRVLAATHPVNEGVVLATSEDRDEYKLPVRSFDPKHTFEAIADPNNAYWVAGEIWYFDLKGDRYAYPFEFQYNRTLGRFIRRSRPANRTLPEGNDRFPSR